MTSTNIVPDGYMQDSKGRLTPLDLIKPIDMQRNDTVIEIVEKALSLQTEMQRFKTQALGDLQAFVELSAEQYGIEIGGVKGNVTLTSYAGDYKIQRNIADSITFDERLQVAKALIDQCIHRWSEGSRSELRILVNDAFQTDKAGKISTGRVLGLRRHDIKDKEWQEAMQAISDSIQITGSKIYLAIYKRIGDDSWDRIPLDIAAL